MLQFVVCFVNIFVIEKINPFNNSLDLLTVDFFIRFYLFSNSNIIMNNKEMTAAREKYL